MKNDGKAAAIADTIQADEKLAAGGILILVFDESPLRSGELGVISCDGAFRVGPTYTNSGAAAIARMGKEIGDSVREILARITEELGGSMIRNDKKPGE